MRRYTSPELGGKVLAVVATALLALALLIGMGAAATLVTNQTVDVTDPANETIQADATISLADTETATIQTVIESSTGEVLLSNSEDFNGSAMTGPELFTTTYSPEAADTYSVNVSVIDGPASAVDDTYIEAVEASPSKAVGGLVSSDDPQTVYAVGIAAVVLGIYLTFREVEDE
jgi:preprotein translocase subunit SecF